MKHKTTSIGPIIELGFPAEMTLSNRQNTTSEQSSVWRSPLLAGAWKIFKWAVVFAIVATCAIALRSKLQAITLEQLIAGMKNVPVTQLVLAVAVTALNFVLLSGYDWIAITYLRKKLPWQKVMSGAIIGYAFSNVFGWMIGGTSVRYWLYARWGFHIIEILAFITVLSVTFWLGMFMLAGITLVALPVQLPAQYARLMPLEPYQFGYLFLLCVAAYLVASLFMRKPLRFGKHQFAFPPFRLSLLQLSVSAIDFGLATLVLYLLLPPDLSVGFGTVLVGYIVAMVVTVILHVPGGFGVLELVVLDILTKEVPEEKQAELIVGVTCGIVLFRVIYYFIPCLIAGLLFFREQMSKTEPPQG
jgi:glycosyltransferase 2 family protein